MGRIKIIYRTLYSRCKIILVFCFFISAQLLSQEDSIKAWKSRIQKNPNDIDALDLLTSNLCYNDPKNGLLYCDQFIEAATRAGNTDLIINAYQAKSICYRELGNYKESLDLDLKAVAFAEEAKDTVNIGNTYNTLAVFYHTSLNYPMAEKYYLKALTIFTALHNTQSEFIVTSNLSDVYAHTNRKKQAEEALERSIKARRTFGDKDYIGVGFYSLASFLISDEKYAKGMQASDSALSYLVEVKNDYYYYLTLMLKAGALSGLEKYEASNLLIFDILKNKVKLDNIDLVHDAYTVLSKNFEKLNKPVEALKYARLEKEASDSIFRKESLNAMNEAQAKFDTEKKEQEIELLNKEKKLNEVEKKRERQYTYMILVILGIVIVFSTALYRRFNLTKKQKKIIESQKKLMEEKQKEITDSIHYAKRIQMALLASERYIEKALNRLRH